MSDALDTIANIIQEDVGKRGLRTDPSSNLITATSGDFARACHSVADHARPALAVVTGFYIPTATPPAGETDGPLGALFLARALVPLGIRVVLITDSFCTRALQAGLSACGLAERVPLITLPSYALSRDIGRERYAVAVFRRAGPLTHLIALERVGPSHTLDSLQAQSAGALGETYLAFLDQVPAPHQDRCHTMRGRDITQNMSPAHWLFEAATARGIDTIGIGDGGNEIGMGKIPWDIVQRNIPGGGLVACRVATDHLIVCGISNWGAYGLATGVRHLRKAPADPALYDIGIEERLLQAMVHAGPLVDGVSAKRTATVDGIPFDQYSAPLRHLAAL
jgi:D-glutamate cyclase